MLGSGAIKFHDDAMSEVRQKCNCHLLSLVFLCCTLLQIEIFVAVAKTKIVSSFTSYVI